MANLGGSFDYTTVEVADQFDPLPAGEYLVEVVKSDVKQTKAGTGEYIALELRVCDGEYENRRLFTNINHRNPNAASQAIGERQLAQLCSAVKLPHALEDTVDLHSVPIKAVVLVEPAKDNYGPRNSVRAFKPAEASVAVVAAQQKVVEMKPAAPWKR